MRTIVYVDGYNFYYGVLRGTPYKWLDLGALMARLVRENNPAAEVTNVKFFTAPILGRAASDPRSPTRQANYHRALKQTHGVQIELGFYDPAEKRGLLLPSQYAEDFCWRHRVQVLEEKQTDVNIALAMYRDAVRSDCEQTVLCSNDSDLAPALNLLRQDYPGIRLGLILPRRAGSTEGRLSGRLTKLVAWTRKAIRVDELAACQLPEAVAVPRRRPAIRPAEW